jgi:hypothetical protein
VLLTRLSQSLVESSYLLNQQIMIIHFQRHINRVEERREVLSKINNFKLNHKNSTVTTLDIVRTIFLSGFFVSSVLLVMTYFA